MRALLWKQGLAKVLEKNMSDELFTSTKKDDEKAHSMFLLSLSDRVLHEMADEENAPTLWRKLVLLHLETMQIRVLLAYGISDWATWVNECGHFVLSRLLLLFVIRRQGESVGCFGYAKLVYKFGWSDQHNSLLVELFFFCSVCSKMKNSRILARRWDC